MSAVQSNCPVCDGMVALAAGTSEAELIRCPECGSDLEVQSLDPPALAEAPAEEEDWGE